MGTDISKTTQRILLVGDPRLTYVDGYDSAASSISQQGPIPGTPQPQQDTEMVLEAHGVQAAGQTLQVRAIRAGLPQPLTGGSYAWKETGDDEWVGWDPPQGITDFEAISYSTTANLWKYPHAIRLANNTIACSVLKSNRYIRVWTRAYDATTWTENDVVDPGADYVFDGSSTLLQLPSGRLLCFYWWEYAGNTNQIYMSYSDDYGTTWTRGQKGCLNASLDTADYQPKRIRAAYLNGNIILLAHVLDVTGVQDRDRLFQYASADLGSSFSLVSQTDGYSAAADMASRGYPEVISDGTSLICAYLKERSSGAAVVPHVRILGNAFQHFNGTLERDVDTSREWGVISGANIFTAGELSLFQDDDGLYYMLGLSAGAGVGTVLLSADTLAWDMPAVNWFCAGTDGTGGSVSDTIHPLQLSACAQGGRTVVISRYTDFVSNRGRSLCATYLGGYTRVNLPGLTAEPGDMLSRASWKINYVPVDLPSDYEVTAPGDAVWVATSAGTPGISLANGGLFLEVNAAADAISYDHTTSTGTMQEGVLALVSSKATSTSATDGYAYCQVRTGDGVNSYEVEIRWNEHQITVIDPDGPTTLATVTAPAAIAAAAAGIQFLVSVVNATPVPGNNGSARVWWRPNSTKPTMRDFSEIALSSSNTLGDRGANANRIVFGADAVTTNPTVEAYFYLVNFTFETLSGEQLIDYETPQDTFGRTLAAKPGYVDSGLSLKAVDGPAFCGDTWHISTSYRYGIENIFPEVSATPRKGWRSVNDAVQQEIVWEFNSTLDQNTLPLNGSVGLYLGEVNFKQASLWGYDGAAWTKLADVDTASGQTGLCFVRTGDVVKPHAAIAGTASGQFYTQNILAGSYIHLSNGDNSNVVRKIRTNGEGAWRQDDGTTKVSRLLLEGVLAGDPLGGVGQSAYIMSKDVLVVTNGLVAYQKYKLTIPVQTTYEGYFKIGIGLLGHVVPMSHQYSHGRALEYTGNYNLDTARSGVRRVQHLGPQRKAVQLSWVEGIDTSDISKSPVSPDYSTAFTGSTDPTGVPAATPWLLTGLAESLRGAAAPFVYCPTYVRQANATNDYQCITRNNLLYGRLVSPVSIENVLGEEWGTASSEVFRVATLTLEEEV